MVMQCRECKKEFVPKSKNQKSCSKECRWKNSCKAYYHRHHEEQKKRVLANYHKFVSTEEGKLRIRANNVKAKAMQRFGTRDRNEIIKRFHGLCAFCGGVDKRMCIHHLDNKGRNLKNPNNDQKNLVTCCHSCHARIHFWGEQLRMKRKSDTLSNRR